MNRFALAYREQQQLFLFDKTYLLGTLLKVGGLSTLTGRFIVQFFWNPTFGHRSAVRFPIGSSCRSR